MVKSHTEQLYVCLINDHMCWLHQVRNTTVTLHGYIYSNIFRNINNISLKIELKNRPDHNAQKIKMFGQSIVNLFIFLKNVWFYSLLQSGKRDLVILS